MSVTVSQIKLETMARLELTMIMMVLALNTLHADGRALNSAAECPRWSWRQKNCGSRHIYSVDLGNKRTGFHVTGPKRGSLGGVVCTGGLVSEGVWHVWSRRCSIWQSICTYYSYIWLNGETLPLRLASPILKPVLEWLIWLRQMAPRPVSSCTPKCNTSKLNNWIGVTWMEIFNKIYSSIMCEQLFKTISKNGVKCQFRSTPGVGCQYGTFTIKKLPRLLHNHNLPTRVELSELVKAFNNSKHVIPISILGKYDAPPMICSTIKRMYDNSKVQIIIRNIETSTKFKVGVKQGDSMDPSLFLFLMMAFY